MYLYNMLLSIIEGIYIYYMFSHFKTKYSIHHPFEYLYTTYNFTKHPISSGIYENKICNLGHLISKLLLFWFIFRHSIVDKLLMYKINAVFIILLLFGSFIMNMNAFIYIIPIIILELYNYKFKNMF